MKFGIHTTAPEPISTAYFINPSHQSLRVCICIRLSLLGNGSVNALPRQRMQATVEELLDASFFIWSVLYQRRVCGSVCVASVSVYVLLKRWSEGSQGHQAVRYVNEYRGSRNQEPLCWQAPAAISTLDWTGLCIPFIVARQGIGKHVSAAMKSSWGRRFLCGRLRIKEK
jgi:hypothetical protein